MQIDTESPRRDSHPKIAPEVPSVSLKHYLSKRHGKGPTRADVEFLPSPKVSATRLLYSPYPPSSLAAPTSSRQTPRTSHVHSHAHSQKQPPQPQQQQHPNPFKNCNLQSEFFPTLPSGRCVVRQWGAHLALEAPGIHITASGETAGKGWSSLQGDDCAFIGYSEAGTIVLGCNDGVGGLRAVTQGRLDSSKWARCLAEKLLLVHCHSSDPGGATSTTSLKNFYYTAWEAARAEAEYGAATSCIARVTPSPSPDDSTACKLQLLSIGDCKVRVYRDGIVIAKTRRSCYAGTEAPVQLGPDGAMEIDLADTLELTITRGDVVVAGSDGLWDNEGDDSLPIPSLGPVLYRGLEFEHSTVLSDLLAGHPSPKPDDVTLVAWQLL